TFYDFWTKTFGDKG
ncbi:putative 50S ribosomal protein L5, partial [Chlamydia psittaci 84-8471/1]